jgi:hypothetical protein
VVNLDLFFPQTRIHIPKVALPFVRDSIRDACRDFLKRTHLWHITKVIGIQPNRTEYNLPIPENTFAQDITYLGLRMVNTSDPIKYSNVTYLQSTEGDLDMSYNNGYGGRYGGGYGGHGYSWGFSGDWRGNKQNASSTVGVISAWGLREDGKTLFIVPIPVIPWSDGLKMKIVLAPDQTATEVPDILYDSWSEAIGAGAAAKVLMTPDKPWTNYEAAAVLQRMFNKAVAANVLKLQSMDSRVMFRRLGT